MNEIRISAWASFHRRFVEFVFKWAMSLDDIARSIHKLIKEEDNDISFVTPSCKENLMIDIVKLKIAERDAAKAAADKKAKRHKIMELIDKKQDEALSNKSVEDAMIDN